MADKSNIEWTEATWNPTTGCTKISPECANCYIERTPPFRMAGRKFVNGRIPLELHGDRLDKPLHWKKPRRIFVNSLSDLFHEDVSDKFIERVFSTMHVTPRHTYQVLTKRAERMQRVLTRPPEEWVHSLMSIVPSWPFSNVWLGVSVGNRKHGLPRIEHLLQTPAAVRFLSIEPLLEDLGRLDLLRLDVGNPAQCVCGHGHGFTRCPNTGGISKTCHISGCKCTGFVRRPGSWNGIDWVIVGGESGPGARPMHPDWVRGIRDQCTAAGVPFFFKQWGEHVGGTSFVRDDGIYVEAENREVYHVDYNGGGMSWHDWDETQNESEASVKVGKKAAGRLLDGRTWDEMPAKAEARA